MSPSVITLLWFVGAFGAISVILALAKLWALVKSVFALRNDVQPLAERVTLLEGRVRALELHTSATAEERANKVLAKVDVVLELLSKRK